MTKRYLRRPYPPVGVYVTLLALVSLGVDAQVPVPGPGYQLRTLDGVNDVGEHFAVTPSNNANSWRTFFYVADREQLVVGSCSTGGCTIDRSITTAGSRRGSFVSATRRPVSNLPIAAYYDAAAGDLRFVECTQLECLSFNERLLDATGDVGAGTSIAIDPISGFPAVAYRDAGNLDLKLFRCSDAACTGGTSTLVDSIGDVGANPHLVFRNDGRAYIAHDDATVAGVRMASAAAGGAFSSEVAWGGSHGQVSVGAAPASPVLYNETGFAQINRRACISDTCGLGTNTTLTGIAEGARPSLTIMPNGNPLLTHRNSNTGAQLATICTAADCSTRSTVTLDATAGGGLRSIALASTTNQPLALYRSQPGNHIRYAFCFNAGCTSTIRVRIGSNGVYAAGVRSAVTAAGAPVVVWRRGLDNGRAMLGVCDGPNCAAPLVRELPFANVGQSRPAVALRSALGNRPFVYSAALGGTAAYDCADATCSSGALRTVSGSGNGTSNISELALRGDGIPVMLYLQTPSNVISVFVCGNAECSAGDARVIADEADSSVNNTRVDGLSLAITPDNRPAVVYTLSSSAGAERRYARCGQAACTSVVLTTIGSGQTFFSIPVAVRSDGRPVFYENLGTPAQSNLVTCDSADCQNPVRSAFGVDGISFGMALRNGTLPAFDVGGIGAVGMQSCADTSCAGSSYIELLSGAFTDMPLQYYGPLVLNSTGVAALGIEEQILGDVFVVAPVVNAIFGNGFEP
jgi:hypothetical protein